MDNAYSAGQRLLCGGYSQYTPSGKSNFIRMGCFGKEPKIGAIVYFYGKSMGRVNHVGIVTDVDKVGDTYEICTVEGNTTAGAGFSRNGGCVATKSYSFNLNEVGGDGRINGFGYPLFGVETCTPEELIAIARGELGYVEKESPKDLNSKTGNAGSKNFTKYGEWYGNNGAYWCQQFVSWCAWQTCKIHKVSVGTGWIKTGDNWKYVIDGNFVKNQWLKVSDRWYAFDGEGIMITGWFLSEGEWYYLNPEDGGMLSGQWIEIDGKSYYLSDSGVMASNAYILGDSGRSYWVDASGVCQTNNEVVK